MKPPAGCAGAGLGAGMAKAARACISPRRVIYGCGNQAGEDNRNVAHMASLLAGMPVDVPGVTEKNWGQTFAVTAI